MPLTDAEVICLRMEPRPHPDRLSRSPLGWWIPAWNQETRQVEPAPRRLTLDVLWKVEDKLTVEQRRQYEPAIEMVTSPESIKEFDWALIHLTPKEKIQALAAVLRPLVEK